MQEIILGIDPGFGRIGYGFIEFKGRDWTHVAHGCIETSAKDGFLKRLEILHKEIEKLIKKYHPTRAAVEELFFAKNAKTGIQVGQARGVILLTLVQAGLPVDEYTPLQVKQALTGYGRAEKGQLERMVRMLLKLKESKLQDDAADALAVAYTAGVSLNMRRRLAQ